MMMTSIVTSIEVTDHYFLPQCLFMADDNVGRCCFPKEGIVDQKKSSAHKVHKKSHRHVGPTGFHPVGPTGFQPNRLFLNL